MPFKDVEYKTTKEKVFELLEQKDENGELMWWSIKEICEILGKKSGTIHYHLNPFISKGILEVGRPRGNYLTPVYRIKKARWEEYLELKRRILNREEPVYKRKKLRED